MIPVPMSIMAPAPTVSTAREVIRNCDSCVHLKLKSKKPKSLDYMFKSNERGM